MSESLELQKAKDKYRLFVSGLATTTQHVPHLGRERRPKRVSVPTSKILAYFLEANPDFTDFQEEPAKMYPSEQNCFEEEWKKRCPDRKPTSS